MKIIETKNAPTAAGPYSQAVIAGDLVFASGQLGINPVSGILADGIIEQTEQSIRNIGAVLNASGLGYEDVVKTTCYLGDMRDFAAFNEVYGKYFSAKPARSCVGVSALPKNAMVEIDAVAVSAAK